MVIGSWQSLENWRAWQNDSTRQALEKILESYQMGSTEYQEYVLGGFIED
jgi:heme-degrading monooxygenase HmoA